LKTRLIPVALAALAAARIEDGVLMCAFSSIVL
jgi:hypothetical protein